MRFVWKIHSLHPMRGQGKVRMTAKCLTGDEAKSDGFLRGKPNQYAVKEAQKSYWHLWIQGNEKFMKKSHRPAPEDQQWFLQANILSFIFFLCLFHCNSGHRKLRSRASFLGDSSFDRKIAVLCESHTQANDIFCITYCMCLFVKCRLGRYLSHWSPVACFSFRGCLFTPGHIFF